MVKILCTPISGQVSNPNSENTFPKDFLTKLDTYQDYSKTLESAKEKVKNDIRFGK